ncbi:LLM class flavin-dependent oxidoreductase [Streptomyces canus]|uniref:LLM class flavin-dependent oxidoreductase n=1 Tax=Streptomyces canus TaxID=58343 RepID=UPI0027D7C3C8|nr:LLM class flavin-dependent oxidoreductase [Streptomyces canus]
MIRHGADADPRRTGHVAAGNRHARGRPELPPPGVLLPRPDRPRRDQRRAAHSGVGAESGYDVDVFGTGAPKSRVRRLGEFVGLLDRLLREDHVSFQGDYYSAVDARTVPGCRQRPRLPFIVAANGPGAASVAARYGQGWVTVGGMAERLDAWWGLVAEASDRMTAALATHGREADPECPTDAPDRCRTGAQCPVGRLLRRFPGPGR